MIDADRGMFSFYHPIDRALPRFKVLSTHLKSSTTWSLIMACTSKLDVQTSMWLPFDKASGSSWTWISIFHKFVFDHLYQAKWLILLKSRKSVGLDGFWHVKLSTTDRPYKLQVRIIFAALRCTISVCTAADIPGTYVSSIFVEHSLQLRNCHMYARKGHHCDSFI